MSLANDTIATIRERAPIVEVIGRHLQLAKKGQRYVGLCPFHNEKTPSFSVSDEKGLFYCFGCHAGGDVFAFVMRYHGLAFHEAVRRLAAEVGVELEPESPEVRRQRIQETRVAAINELAMGFFEAALWHAHGKAARAYLKQRGVPETFARRRHLGFGGAPGALLAHLAAKGFDQQAAASAGLLFEDQRRSLFDDRLIFPITDAQGRVAGFGGRRLDSGAQAKYVNSHASVLFSKKRVLYGLKMAEPAMRMSKRAILVEGFMDVLACQMAGQDNAVAPLGTAFTAEHAEQLGRLVKECVLLFDGDGAGQKAARRATQHLLQAKLKALVAPLPKGEDPDSMLRGRGAAALTRLTEQAKPAVEHFLGVAFGRPKMSIEEKAEAARELVPLIAAFGSGLERDLYMSQLAHRVGVSLDQLQQDVAQAMRKWEKQQSVKKVAKAPGPVEASGSAATRPKATRESSSPEPSRSQPVLLEFEMLRQLLLYPELRPRFSELAEFALSEEMRNLLDALANSTEPLSELLAGLLTQHGIPKAWVERLLAVRPAAAEMQHAEESAEDLAQRTFDDVMARLKGRHVDAALQDVIRELGEVEAEGGDTSDLMRRKRELSRRKRALVGRRGGFGKEHATQDLP